MSARYTLSGDARAEAKLSAALPRIARAVEEARIEGFAGLVLGGGYGRGEGGATPEGGLYNDLDFFVLVDIPERRIPAEAAKLEAAAEGFSAELGVDVDFAFRVAARLRLDERRIMVQELLRGNAPLAPEGFCLKEWAGLREFPAEEIPAVEAARLLMNRGMGLLLSRGREDGFAVRNLNKAVLGAGDAKLVAEGRYAWGIGERERRLGEAAYSKACAYKRRPTGRAEDAPGRAEAEAAWLEAHGRLWEARGKDLSARTLREAARYAARSGRIGRIAEAGLDCTVRTLRRVAEAVEKGGAPDARLMEEWRTFN